MAKIIVNLSDLFKEGPHSVSVWDSSGMRGIDKPIEGLGSFTFQELDGSLFTLNLQVFVQRPKDSEAPQSKDATFMQELAQHLIGKVIAKTDYTNQVLKITFTDGQDLLVRAHAYEDSPPSIMLLKPKPKGSKTPSPAPTAES